MFWLKEHEAHRAVVHNVSNDSAIVGTYLSGLELFLFTNHFHIDRTGKVEHSVRNLTDTMLIVAYRSIDLSHVCVDSLPFATTGTNFHLVVVLERSSLCCWPSESLVECRTFLCSRYARFLVNRSTLIEEQRAITDMICAVLAHFRTHTTLAKCHADVRHLQSLAANVMIISYFVDGPQFATAHLPWFSPFVVEPCAVGPRSERHVPTEVILCHIFIPLQQSVVVCSVKIISLVPCHFASFSQCTHTQLGMGLIASCLLTLPYGRYVARQRTVVVSIKKIIFCSGIHLLVIAVNGYGHAHLVDYGPPVAVSIRRIRLKLVKHWHERTFQHLLRRLITFVT